MAGFQDQIRKQGVQFDAKPGDRLSFSRWDEMGTWNWVNLMGRKNGRAAD